MSQPINSNKPIEKIRKNLFIFMRLNEVIKFINNSTKQHALTIESKSNLIIERTIINIEDKIILNINEIKKLVLFFFKVSM